MTIMECCNYILNELIFRLIKPEYHTIHSTPIMIMITVPFIQLNTLSEFKFILAKSSHLLLLNIDPHREPIGTRFIAEQNDVFDNRNKFTPKLCCCRRRVDWVRWNLIFFSGRCSLLTHSFDLGPTTTGPVKGQWCWEEEEEEQKYTRMDHSFR